MAWWVVNVGSSGTYRAESASSSQAITDGLVVSGPYSTQAAAQAAIPHASSPGAGSSGSSGSSGTSGSTGGCGPQAIYQALLNAGFSTVQAVGAMANAMNESGLNPETPAGDGGHSFGLWQFNDNSYPDAPHPTGNCARDIELAVGYLKTHVSGSALNGTTGAEVAGNFAANFEKCQGCQPGGAQYASRVANAATVMGWISSGNWPTSSTGLSGSSTGGVSGGGTPAPPCAVSINLPLTGQVCLLTKGAARGLLGGALMVAGGLLVTVGLAVLLVAAGGPGAVRALPAARIAGRVVPLPVVRGKDRGEQPGPLEPAA